MESGKFKPLGDRVLVRPNQTENKTKGGIIITRCRFNYNEPKSLW